MNQTLEGHQGRSVRGKLGPQSANGEPDETVLGMPFFSRKISS